ncbi:MAG: DUF805 domain-containing protein [Bifidobacteriaceae bacterium]|nr:DUF805 domain-containing protein [Bifidobacteriaceae bacterium]
MAIKRFFAKYAVFSGRASRSEYWWAYLFTTVVSWILSIPAAVWLSQVFSKVIQWMIDSFEASNKSSVPEPEISAPGALTIVFIALAAIWGLAILVPQLAITWRRLHDGGFSGLWYLLVLVGPGSIVIFIFTLLPSKPEGVRFDAPGSGAHILPEVPAYPPPTQPYAYGQPAGYPPAPYPAAGYPAPGSAPAPGQPPAQPPAPYAWQGEPPQAPQAPQPPQA